MGTTRLVDVEAIKQLKARYCRLLDQRDWTAWRKLLADDLRVDDHDVGADRYLADARARVDGSVSVHHAHMPEIQLSGNGTAVGRWSIMDLVQPIDCPSGGAHRFGRSVEGYRHENGEWRIASLTSDVDRVDPPPRGAPGRPPGGMHPHPSWLDGLPLPRDHELVEIEAIRQLKARYFRSLDTKDWDAWRAVFVPDASFEVPLAPPDLGPTEFSDLLKNRHAESRTAHQGHLPEIRLVDRSSARGIWVLHDVVSQPVGSPHPAHAGYGFYEEEYRWDGGCWRISLLRLSYLRDDPISAERMPYDDDRPPVSPGWLAGLPCADVTRLADLEEIRQLKARYFRALDTKDWPALRAVFADDARVRSIRGDFSADEFIASVSATLADTVTAHQGHMPEIRFTSETTARGHWALEDYVEWEGEPPRRGFIGYGHYQEEYRRAPDGWKILSLQIGRLRMDRLSRAPLPTR